MHVLLTETILCHGGSLELVKIMNRLGASASLDTCNRLATMIVEKRLKNGIKQSLVPGMLTVVSVDNIDILQPHAVVSATDATRSWHGTSIQCMQPLPSTGRLSMEERVTNISQAPDQSTDTHPTDNTHSPRHKRRRRTLTEQRFHMVNPLPDSPLLEENIMYGLSHTTPTLADFILTPTETTAMHRLKLDIH